MCVCEWLVWWPLPVLSFATRPQPSQPHAKISPAPSLVTAEQPNSMCVCVCERTVTAVPCFVRGETHTPPPPQSSGMGLFPSHSPSFGEAFPRPYSALVPYALPSACSVLFQFTRVQPTSRCGSWSLPFSLLLALVLL
ncbi:hypothetical protein F5883DRAFT_564128 [Diaporthe sp. PMI_573]|nr:hypothetical protein F5883DRAFT_564128 [Diaporthaceae sp. PMI_573]